MNSETERILCAAIWYKDFPLVKDNINAVGFERPINCDRRSKKNLKIKPKIFGNNKN